MSYNIEEHEDHLKNKMPYDMGDEQWEALQQRIKSKLLQEPARVLLPRPRRLPLKIVLGAAAGLALLVSVCTFTARKPVQAPVVALQVPGNAEQHLDQAIGNLNEQELNWIHQLNENEISEQGEYFEN